MFENIDNSTKLLGEDLKIELKKDSKVRMAASCFSMYAFEELKEELSNIKEMQFLFTAPTFTKTRIEDDIKKEKREFFIPKIKRESSLYGTEFEIKLRNEMTLKAIAKECAKWVKEKVRFKTNTTNSTIPNFIAIENTDKKSVTYNPIDGFTTTDLGYQKGNSLFAAITKADFPEQSKYLFSMFDEIWNDKSKVEDITETVIEMISSAYQENSPEFIYFFILYNIFSEFLEDITLEDYLPNESTGYKDSIVWSKLYNFQKDGAVGAINKLEKYNGCILADSVGLGKTFTALAVMKYYSSRNKNILVLAPKKLAHNWNQYRDNVKTNIFYKDHIHFDVLYHTDLGRTKGYSNGHHLSLFNWDNYDIVVIDESHNFRNASSYKDKETRYDFLLNKVMKSGVKTKVLMLSATPVNNRFVDLRNQIALAYGEDVNDFNKKLGLKKSFESILIQAQKVFNDWSKLPTEERKTADLMSQLDIDFSILLDKVTIARSRKHITKYYNANEIGNFPTRLKPISYYSDLAKKEDTIGYDGIFQMLINVSMCVYAPMNYILPSRLSKYERRYDSEVGAGTLKQAHREKALQRLMTINVLKRLESCVESFRITLKRIANIYNQTYQNILKYEDSGFNSYIVDFAQIEEEDLEEDDFDVSDYGTIGKIKIDFADMDLLTWKNQLKSDLSILDELFGIMQFITPDKDIKLQKLLEVISNKIEKPFNEKNQKILIFSAFADTANYLYQNLSPIFKEVYGINSAFIQGGESGNQLTIGGDKSTERLLTLFSPLSKERGITFPNEKHLNIDILIATDCVSEGQNLQDCDICINYDIHWNPVRIVQRFGRIDRIGSQNKFIQLVCFWPNMKLDDYINLNERVKNRMLLVDATATGDDNIISEDQLELKYRKEQLQKLQQGELQELEDVDGNITITDLGLNEFRMDAVSLLKQYGEPTKIAKGMHSVVKSDVQKGIYPGVIYILKNYNEGVNINRQNRLHPYYIVHLDNDGNIIHNHLQVKNILDTLRTSCKNITEPILSLCKAFNLETDDGFNMQKYNNLLKRAVEGILEVKSQSDLNALFTQGSIALENMNIKGLEDFELLAFIVVK
jgi:hypothetical protein